MRKKKTIQRIIAVTVTGIALIATLLLISKIVERKASSYKYSDFFQDHNNFDILFMGTSHVINAVFPMELWENYGITSYNFGGHSNRLATTYWVMELALEHTTPSLMVIDCYALGENTKTSNNFSYVHLSLDAFPFSKTKIDAVKDLLNDDEMAKRIETGQVIEDEKRIPIGLLWDFSVYHSRWDSLNKDDFSPGKNLEKGAESRIAVSAPNKLLSIDKSEMLSEDTVGVYYLERMITDCQNRGIDVLLTFLPFPATESQLRDANRVYEIAQKYNVNYINFLDLEDVVDYNVDCYDANSHLNPSGAKKVTDYLGEYIINHYDFTDKRAIPEYSYWKADYQVYKENKISKLRAQNKLDRYLMLLADKNYDLALEINDHQFLKDDYYTHFIENLGVNIDKISSDVDCLAISVGKECTYLKDFKASGKTEETAIGQLTIQELENNNYTILLNHKSLYSITNDPGVDFRIIVIDKESKEIFDVINSCFYYNSSGSIVSATVKHEKSGS